MKNIDEINRENLFSSAYFDAHLSAEDTREALDIVATLVAELAGELEVQQDDLLTYAATFTKDPGYYRGAGHALGRVIDMLDELSGRLDPELA